MAQFLSYVKCIVRPNMRKAAGELDMDVIHALNQWKTWLAHRQNPIGSCRSRNRHRIAPRINARELGILMQHAFESNSFSGLQRLEEILNGPYNQILLSTSRCHRSSRIRAASHKKRRQQKGATTNERTAQCNQTF